MRRGEVRWYTFQAPDKRRPVLILTRDSAIGFLNALSVAPITTTVRDIPSEVFLSPEDGLLTDCAANMDNIQTVPKDGRGESGGCFRSGPRCPCLWDVNLTDRPFAQTTTLIPRALSMSAIVELGSLLRFSGLEGCQPHRQDNMDFTLLHMNTSTSAVESSARAAALRSTCPIT